ncbi:MAG TPA: pyridoxal kinase PdxY [Acetobacteraceae bacterium]|nr:pyridoxal kinase PdxY [Acetobacteraceae bacterium]
MNILSVQSWVSYGHVGNAAALFPLQRLGAEVWAVNSVQFSNHTGYGHWTGRVAGAAEIADLIAGIAARGVLPACDAVLSGYLGDPAIGDAVLDAASRVKAANPRALYCCDPVIGDVGRGVFVREGVATFFAERALPRADIVTPNHFELEHLTGQRITRLAEARDAVAALQARGPRCVLVTSLATEATPADAIDLLAAEDGAFHLLRTPRLPVAANGAGDVMAALFLFHRLRTGNAAAAMAAAASALFGVLHRTAQEGAAELLLVAAQEELVAPTHRFAAVAC